MAIREANTLMDERVSAVNQVLGRLACLALGLYALLHPSLLLTHHARHVARQEAVFEFESNFKLSQVL